MSLACCEIPQARFSNSMCALLIQRARFQFCMPVANSTPLFLLFCAPVVNATRPFLVPRALFWKHFLCDQMTEIKIPCFEGNTPCFRAKFLVAPGKIHCAKMRFLVLAPTKIDTPAVRCHLVVVKCHKPVFKFHVCVANTTRSFLITHTCPLQIPRPCFCCCVRLL